MKSRLSLLALFAVLSTAAVCQPKTPTPPPTSVVLVDNAQGATDCTYMLTFSGAPHTSAAHVASATFTTPQSLVNADSATADCLGFQLATLSPASLLSNRVTITLVALPPPVAPLPAPPTRDQLAHARAIFQGLYVTTKQLGTVPSFGGVETGMLDDPADRLAVYDAIKAAGGDAIILAVDCHYKEPGVAYPNETACNNDWTDTTTRFPGATPYPATGDTSTIVARVAEAVRAGLMVIYMQGGDEIDFSAVAQQVGPQMAALRAYPDGDLTRYISLGPGFDSIWQIANGPPSYQVSNQTLVDLLLADRAAIGPQGVINLEFPNGVAFGGGGALSGKGWFTSPAGSTVNVYLQEFANLSPGNQPTPAIVGGAWDAEHNDYAPTFSSDATAWNQVWQVADRTLATWLEPPDEISQGKCDRGQGPKVPVTGGPNDGQSICVFADVSNPSIYPGRNPSDIQVFVAAEFGTWQHTHGQSTTQQVINAGKYLSNVGYPVVWGPVASSSSAPRPKR